MSSCTERNPIRHRTQSNQTADAIQSDTERNPIGWRTESDQVANANGRGCSCFSCTNQANRVRTAPTKQTELSTRGCSCLSCTNKTNRARTAPTKQTELSFHKPQSDPRPARYHAPRCHEQPIAPINGHYLLATLHRIHDVRSHMLR